MSTFYIRKQAKCLSNIFLLLTQKTYYLKFAKMYLNCFLDSRTRTHFITESFIGCHMLSKYTIRCNSLTNCYFYFQLCLSFYTTWPQAICFPLLFVPKTRDVRSKQCLITRLQRTNYLEWDPRISEHRSSVLPLSGFFANRAILRDSGLISLNWLLIQSYLIMILVYFFQSQFSRIF